MRPLEFESFHFSVHDEPTVMVITVAFSRLTRDDWETELGIIDTRTGQPRQIEDFPPGERKLIEEMVEAWASRNAGDVLSEREQDIIDRRAEAHFESRRGE